MSVAARSCSSWSARAVARSSAGGSGGKSCCQRHRSSASCARRSAKCQSRSCQRHCSRTFRLAVARRARWPQFCERRRDPARIAAQRSWHRASTRAQQTHVVELVLARALGRHRGDGLLHHRSSHVGRLGSLSCSVSFARRACLRRGRDDGSNSARSSAAYRAQEEVWIALRMTSSRMRRFILQAPRSATRSAICSRNFREVLEIPSYNDCYTSAKCRPECP